MIVVDTNVISELTRPKPSPSVIAWIELNHHQLTTTAITVGELFRGIATLPRGKRRQRIQDATERTIGTLGGRACSYDEMSARIYAEMTAARSRAGHPLTVEDGMIAAICAREGAALATRNVDDFSGLKLELIDPWAA